MLIKCVECGHEVSDVAKACPNCGYPVGKGKIEKAVFGEKVASNKDDLETESKSDVGIERLIPFVKDNWGFALKVFFLSTAFMALFDTVLYLAPDVLLWIVSIGLTFFLVKKFAGLKEYIIFLVALVIFLNIVSVAMDAYIVSLL